MLEKGLGMLDAAIALESTLQGPKMQEFFRSVRTVGWDNCFSIPCFPELRRSISHFSASGPHG